MRFSIVLVFTILGYVSFAQQESELQAGDTLYFATCDSSNYTYIDYYKKSRIEDGDTLNYNKLEFWEFYNAFFELGDFDVTRMPCERQEDFCIVKHMMQLTAEGSPPVTVVIGLMSDGLSAAYIVEDAFLAEEVLLAPKQ